MRDIRLPETSDKVIDIFNINENISGIILAYKCNENLTKLLKAIMSSNYADSFKLIDFGK